MGRNCPSASHAALSSSAHDDVPVDGLKETETKQRTAVLDAASKLIFQIGRFTGATVDGTKLPSPYPPQGVRFLSFSRFSCWNFP